MLVPPTMFAILIGGTAGGAVGDLASGRQVGSSLLYLGSPVQPRTDPEISSSLATKSLLERRVPASMATTLIPASASTWLAIPPAAPMPITRTSTFGSGLLTSPSLRTQRPICALV